MRNDVILYLNGKRRRINGSRAFLPMTEFLRDECRLVGTKVGCGEGDCGACTILVGRPESGVMRYRTVTSCLLTPCQLDGSHVITVEGLEPGGGLSAVQEAMVDHHGSQCGYCTPGIVNALTGLFETNPDPDDQALREGLTGNLCRCTGYLPILDSGRAVDRSQRRPLAELYPDSGMTEELAGLAREPLFVEIGNGRRVFFRPNNTDDAFAFKAANPSAVIVSGGTDLGVWKTRQGYDPPLLLSLAGLAGWDQIGREGNVVSIGANVTWAALEEFAAREAPELLEVTHHFASPQIRNVATFVGNVAHGSPIADSVSYLHIVGASLEIVGPRGSRSVDLGDFFTGYRQTVLESDELIARVVVPLPGVDERIKLYKISKRKEMDISTFRAGVRVRESKGRVDRAVVAFAGVGPKVLRLRATEAFLAGRPFVEETFREAGRLARTEIEPISDVRGSRDFRLILAENLLLKFFFDCVGDDPGRRSCVD